MAEQEAGGSGDRQSADPFWFTAFLFDPASELGLLLLTACADQRKLCQTLCCDDGSVIVIN
jgi:hypothetical protein